MACSNSPGCVGGGCKNSPSPKEVFGRGGPIGTGTLWAEGDNLFQRICYSPPYTTGCSQSVDCIDTIATQAGCVYDAECPSGTRCRDAECKPMRSGPQYNSSGSYGSFAMGNSHSIPAINPRAIDSFDLNDPALLRHVPAPFNRNMDSARKFVTQTCPSSPGVLLTRATPDSKAGLVCPLFPGNVKERNCSNCIQTLESCNMLSGFLSREQYDECKQRESCFQYDIGLENGFVHPVGYKITPECLETAQKALLQCSHDCSPVPRPYF